MFKFMLWSSLVFFEHGSMYQLLVAQAICIAQVLVHVQQWPWIRDSENRFHLVWLLLAVVMAAAGTGLKYLDLKVRGGGLHGYPWKAQICFLPETPLMCMTYASRTDLELHHPPPHMMYCWKGMLSSFHLVVVSCPYKSLCRNGGSSKTVYRPEHEVRADR